MHPSGGELRQAEDYSAVGRMIVGKSPRSRVLRSFGCIVARDLM